MDRECLVTLISTSAIRDSEGRLTGECTKERNVYATCKSVRQSEFFSAGQSGIRPELELEVWAEEYEGETIVELDGERYTIYRSYSMPGGDKTELYLTKKVGIIRAD